MIVSILRKYRYWMFVACCLTGPYGYTVDRGPSCLQAYAIDIIDFVHTNSRSYPIESLRSSSFLQHFMHVPGSHVFVQSSYAPLYSAVAIRHPSELSKHTPSFLARFLSSGPVGPLSYL